MIDDVAQTNLRLYLQVLHDGWDGPDLRRVVASYELAARLLSGRLRETGKEFVAHLVGTASIVAAMGERPDVVIAALLHAAYADGEFGDRTRGMTEPKRHRVRDAAGTQAELLVAEFSSTPWGRDEAMRLCGQVSRFDALQRDVVVILLANELEDHVDLGHRFRRPHRMALERSLAAGDLAEALGFQSVAECLRAAVADEEAAVIPPELMRPQGSKNFIPPLSHRERVRVRLARPWRRPTRN